MVANLIRRGDEWQSLDGKIKGHSRREVLRATLAPKVVEKPKTVAHPVGSALLGAGAARSSGATGGTGTTGSTGAGAAGTTGATGTIDRMGATGGAFLGTGAPPFVHEPHKQPMSHEAQGTGHDPGAVGHELQGRKPKPDAVEAPHVGKPVEQPTAKLEQHEDGQKVHVEFKLDAEVPKQHREGKPEKPHREYAISPDELEGKALLQRHEDSPKKPHAADDLHDDHKKTKTKDQS